MTFTFNAAIPQASDFIDDSQGDLLNNNIAINGIFARNHVPMIDVTNGQGRHTFVEMTNSSGIPAPAGSLQDKSGTLYTKRASSVSDLFYSNDNSTNQYQLSNVVKTSDNNRFPYFGTNTSLTAVPVSGKGNGGWTFLPGGLVMQYGLVVLAEFTSNTCAVVFPIPFSGVPYCCQVTANTGNAPLGDIFVSSSTPTATGVNVNRKSGGSGSGVTNVWWMVIGPY